MPDEDDKPMSLAAEQPNKTLTFWDVLFRRDKVLAKVRKGRHDVDAARKANDHAYNRFTQLLAEVLETNDNLKYGKASEGN